jgi:hypothetical protein
VSEGGMERTQKELQKERRKGIKRRKEEKREKGCYNENQKK